MAKKIRGRNEGSLHRRPSGTWRAQISLDGKRISFGAQTKAECQEWLRKMQFELDRGYDFLGGKILLGEYLHQWLGTSAASLRPKTAQQYRQVISKHIIPLIGHLQLNELRISGVEKFYGELIQSGVGIRTVRLTHAILHRALERAVHYEVILRNPAHQATLPRYSQAEMQVLDESQVGHFLVVARESRFEALYQLAVTC